MNHHFSPADTESPLPKAPSSTLGGRTFTEENEGERNKPVANGSKFWSKVAIAGPNDCWPWREGVDKDGYGRFYVGKKSLIAHRHAFRLAVGEPGKLNVCHGCDNPPCCNPRHLFAATQQANIADRDAKGRTARGERHGRTIQALAKRTTEATP